jgi:hypothetical protein
MGRTDSSFVVDLWSTDEIRIEEELVRASCLSLGRLAFDIATITYPDRMVTLRGPGAFEVRTPSSDDSAGSFVQVL